MKIGTKVKVKYNDAYDREYDRCAIAGRRLIGGHIGVITDKSNSHGSCYEVSYNDGQYIAWFEPDELTEIATPEMNINQVAMGCKPDPTNFKIVDLEHVGNCTIVCANYGGLTFGGDKLMVLRGVYEKHQLRVLDPHFLNEQHPVVARFQPTPEGFHMARIIANHISYPSHRDE